MKAAEFSIQPGTLTAASPASGQAISGVHRARLIFLGLQAIHIICFWAYVGQVQAVLLAASGILCICLYSYLLKVEIVSGGIAISPFVLYLCAALLIIGVGPAWAALVYWEGLYGTFMYGRYDVSANLMEGHALLLLGDWFLIAGYTAVAKWRGSPNQITEPARGNSIAAIALLTIAVGGVLEIGFYLGLDFSAFGSWYKIVSRYSGPAGLLMLLFLLSRTVGPRRQTLLVLIILCLALNLSLALRSNMKQETMVVLLPVLVFLFSNLRKAKDGRPRLNWPVVVISGVIGVFVVMILFPFNELRRNYIWEGRVRMEAPNPVPFLMEAFRAAVPGSPSFAMMHEFPETGFWSFLSRHAYLISSGWSSHYVAQQGHIDGEFLRDGLVGLIPRALWSDKPMVSAGRKVAVMIGQAQDVESATTSTDAGSMAGALYLNFGFPCLIIGMFVNGALLCLIWSWVAPDILINPFAALTAMMLYVAAGRYFASAADGNIAFYVTLLVLYVPLIYATKRMFRGPEPPTPGRMLV